MTAPLYAHPPGPVPAAPSASTPAHHGYDRAALDAFFAAVDAERARLHAAIAREQHRVAQARIAIDARRLLAAMVSEACDEIAAKRRQRDLVVRRVADAADASAIQWVAPAPGAPVDAAAVR